MNIMQARGLFHDQSKGRFGIVFNIPSNLRRCFHAYQNQHVSGTPQFTSLGQELSKSTGVFRFVRSAPFQAPRLSISQRVKFALELCQTVSELHFLGWLHESIHSDNIRFSSAVGQSNGSDSHRGTSHFILGKPYLFGFSYSRIDEGISIPKSSADFTVERNVCQHPERQFNSSNATEVVRYEKYHDIYSLGVILLEIGLGRKAIELGEYREGANLFKGANSTPQKIRAHLILQAESRLAEKMGSSYTEVVIKCLKGNFGVLADDAENTALQRSFSETVVEKVRKLAAHI
jgi:serine/threonine protein kinase